MCLPWAAAWCRLYSQIKRAAQGGTTVLFVAFKSCKRRMDGSIYI